MYVKRPQAVLANFETLPRNFPDFTRQFSEFSKTPPPFFLFRKQHALIAQPTHTLKIFFFAPAHTGLNLSMPNNHWNLSEFARQFLNFANNFSPLRG